MVYAQITLHSKSALPTNHERSSPGMATPFLTIDLRQRCSKQSRSATAGGNARTENFGGAARASLRWQTRRFRLEMETLLQYPVPRNRLLCSYTTKTLLDKPDL